MKKKQSCSKKVLISFVFRDCFSYSRRQFYGRLAKISLCIFRRKIWRIGYLESLSFFLRFPISSKSFQNFDEKFLAGLSQLHSACPDEDFFSIFEGRKREKIFFSKKLHCYFFQNLNEEDPQCSCKHGYGRLVKNSLYMFRRTFLQLGFLESLSFSRHFRNSSRKLQSFDENVLTGWSQLHSTCTEAQFQEIYFSFEKFINSLVIFFESQRQIWGSFGENFLVWLSKLHSPLLKKHF